MFKKMFKAKMLVKFKGFAMAEFAIGIVITALMAYCVFFTIGIIAKKRSDTLISAMSSLQKSIDIFKTVNNSIPGDLFAPAIEGSSSSALMQNDACGNGDGVISYHSLCGDATSLNTNNQVSKCNVASYDSQTAEFKLYNETMLFAKHLSMFGVIEKQASTNLTQYFGNAEFNSENTISSGYKKAIFMPMAFSKSTSTNPLAIANEKNLHTIFVVSLTSFASSVDSNNLYNTTNITITNNPNSNQYILNSGVANCSTIPLVPAGTEIAYKDADYIDKKIDDGNAIQGNVRYCQDIICSTQQESSKVVLSFLERF